MSAIEYRTVVMAMKVLLTAYAEQTSRDIIPLMAEQAKHDRTSSEWLSYCFKINEIYENYTDLVNVLYPENEREIGDWVQVLDEKVGTKLLADWKAKNA